MFEPLDRPDCEGHGWNPSRNVARDRRRFSKTAPDRISGEERNTPPVIVSSRVAFRRASQAEFDKVLKALITTKNYISPGPDRIPHRFLKQIKDTPLWQALIHMSPRAMGTLYTGAVRSTFTYGAELWNE